MMSERFLKGRIRLQRRGCRMCLLLVLLIAGAAVVAVQRGVWIGAVIYVLFAVWGLIVRGEQQEILADYVRELEKTRDEAARLDAKCWEDEVREAEVGQQSQAGRLRPFDNEFPAAGGGYVQPGGSQAAPGGGEPLS